MKDILFEWNPWWSEKYLFKAIPRDKINDIKPWLERKEVLAIIGVRRAGKTTLLYQLIDYLTLQKKVPSKNILFIKADDDRVKTENLIDESLELYKKWVNPEQKVYLFIDEIQEIQNWQKTIKRIYDLDKNIKIIISGSNAAIIKENLSSFLAGRLAYFEVYPFSFSEFLTAKGILINSDDELQKNKPKIKHLLTEYLVFGSFPEVCLETNEKTKKELASFYFDSIFYKDILRRNNIRNPVKIEKLVKYLLQNISNLTNFSKLAKILDLTVDSVVEYLRVLEDAYLIFHVNLFEFSYKKQIINPKKIYCVDQGIRNIVGFKFSDDIGRLYENIVYTNLKRKNKEIFYWKNKNECDFVVKEGKKIEAIQVGLDEGKEREVAGLLEFMNEFKLKKGLIITDNYEGEEKIENKTIKFMPLWKWLLTY